MAGAGEWKTLSERTVHETPWVEFIEKKFKTRADKEGTYTYMTTPGAVAIIPITENGEVLLQQQYRYLFDAWSWEVPTGGMTKGEDPKKAAERELQEETGATDATLEYIGEMWANDALLDEIVHVYIARGVKPVAGHAFDDMEPIRSRCTIPFEQIPNWIASGCTKNSFVIATLMKAYGNEFIRTKNKQVPQTS